MDRTDVAGTAPRTQRGEPFPGLLYALLLLPHQPSRGNVKTRRRLRKELRLQVGSSHFSDPPFKFSVPHPLCMNEGVLCVGGEPRRPPHGRAHRERALPGRTVFKQKKRKKQLPWYNLQRRWNLEFGSNDFFFQLAGNLREKQYHLTPR